MDQPAAGPRPVALDVENGARRWNPGGTGLAAEAALRTPGSLGGRAPTLGVLRLLRRDDTGDRPRLALGLRPPESPRLPLDAFLRGPSRRKLLREQRRE